MQLNDIWVGELLQELDFADRVHGYAVSVFLVDLHLLDGYEL